MESKDVLPFSQQLATAAACLELC